MTDPRTHSSIDLQEITERNQTARRMIAGFAAEMPALAEFWRYLATALTDNLVLSFEVTRLTTALADARFEGATLLAAALATLDADADGEADPLWYLRDELSARQATSQRYGRTS